MRGRFKLMFLVFRGGSVLAKFLKARTRAHPYSREAWVVLNPNEIPNFTSNSSLFHHFVCVKTSKLRTKITSINKHF